MAEKMSSPVDIKPEIIKVKEEPKEKDPAQEREEHIEATIDNVIGWIRKQVQQQQQRSGHNNSTMVAPIPLGGGQQLQQQNGKEIKRETQEEEESGQHHFGFGQTMGDHLLVAQQMKQQRRRRIGPNCGAAVVRRRKRLPPLENLLWLQKQRQQRRMGLEIVGNQLEMVNSNNMANGIGNISRRIKIVQQRRDKRNEIEGGGGKGVIKQIKITQQIHRPKRVEWSEKEGESSRDQGRSDEGNGHHHFGGQRQQQQNDGGEGERQGATGEKAKRDNDEERLEQAAQVDSMLLVIFTDKSLWWHFFRTIKMGSAAECLTCGWKCSTRQRMQPPLAQFQAHLESRHPELLKQKQRAMREKGQADSSRPTVVDEFFILPHEMVDFLNQCYKRGLSVTQAHHELCLMKIARDLRIVRHWYGKFSSGEYDLEMLAKKIPDEEIIDEEEEEYEEISQEELMAQLKQHKKLIPNHQLVRYPSRFRKCPVCANYKCDISYLRRHMELVHSQHWELEDLRAICNLKAVQNNEVEVLKEEKKKPVRMLKENGKKQVGRPRKRPRKISSSSDQSSADDDDPDPSFAPGGCSLTSQSSANKKENGMAKLDDKMMEHGKTTTKVVKPSIACRKKEVLERKKQQFWDDQRRELEKLASEMYRDSIRLTVGLLNEHYAECSICKRRVNNLHCLRDHILRNHGIEIDLPSLRKRINGHKKQQQEGEEEIIMDEGEPVMKEAEQNLAAEKQPLQPRSSSASSAALVGQSAAAPNEDEADDGSHQRQSHYSQLKQQQQRAAVAPVQINVLQKPRCTPAAVVGHLQQQQQRRLVQVKQFGPQQQQQQHNIIKTTITTKLPMPLPQATWPGSSSSRLASFAPSAATTITFQKLRPVLRSAPISYSLARKQHQEQHQQQVVRPPSAIEHHQNDGSAFLQQQQNRLALMGPSSSASAAVSHQQQEANSPLTTQWSSLKLPKEEQEQQPAMMMMTVAEYLQKRHQQQNHTEPITEMPKNYLLQQQLRPKNKMPMPSSTNEMLWKRVKDEIDDYN